MAEGPLFMVDNSEAGVRHEVDYLREWSELASSIDIATGFFEIGSLLDLDGPLAEVRQDLASPPLTGATFRILRGSSSEAIWRPTGAP